MAVPSRHRFSRTRRSGRPFDYCHLGIRSPGKTTDGLWYHVRVQNERRWNPASDAQVYLLSIEEEDAAGRPTSIWIGNAALGWRHESPQQPKRIGAPAECDLCHILKEPLGLYLSPIFPASVRPSGFQKKCRIVLTLLGRSAEVDSERYRYRISWNGEWSDDRSQQMRNLVIEEIEDP